MKKNVNYIVAFVLGIITATSIGVAAYTISAKEIGYSPKDSSWKVNNVADAIESLKTLKGGSQNYSLDEQVVGTWIDGKPLYQKIIISNQELKHATSYQITSEGNIETLFKAEHIRSYVSNESSWYYGEYNVGGNDYIHILPSVHNGNISIYVLSAKPSLTNSMFLCLYTKTTDSVQSS